MQLIKVDEVYDKQIRIALDMTPNPNELSNLNSDSNKCPLEKLEPE